MKCTDKNTQAAIPIQDSTGKLLKNVCLVFDPPQDQPGADAGCKAGYMYLLQIDSADLQTMLFAILDQALGASGVPFAFRVDGLRDSTDKKWYYYSKGAKVPAFAGLKWYMTSDTLDGSDSLILTNLAYPVQKGLMTSAIDGIPLSENSVMYICEY